MKKLEVTLAGFFFFFFLFSIIFMLKWAILTDVHLSLWFLLPKWHAFRTILVYRLNHNFFEL